jgi:hypothetical protein
MFTSYAQNFENLMLRRALKNVAHGNYIDIGARVHDVHSLSLAFYLRGWRGKHIQPLEEFAQKLRSARPNELVVQALIGEQEGFGLFYSFPNTVLSTSLKTVANIHLSSRYQLQERTSKILTLDSILDMRRELPVH